MGQYRQNPVKEMIEGDFSLRIHRLNREICSFTTADQQIKNCRKNGNYSVFNAGAYDILTLNHILGLVQCRVLGAMALLNINEIKTQHQQLAVHEIASSNSVYLMVTLDTNTALSESKSRRAEKGGAPRPTLDWSTRAAMLAVQSIPIPGYVTRRHLVDYVTRHGPDCCDACSKGTCINEDNALMTIQMQPDMVVINANSLKTVADIEKYKKEGLLPNTTIRIIREEKNQYFDPVLGAPIKTTSIVQRARS